MLFNFENWDNIIHFVDFFASIGEKNILFGFGNDTRKQSRFYSEKNHCRDFPKSYVKKYTV